MAGPSAADIETLTWTLLGEARGEGEEGMAAVAHVIRNRAESGLFSSGDPVKIALEPNQFSTNNAGAGGNQTATRLQVPVGSPLYKKAEAIVRSVIYSEEPPPDPTRNALAFHTTSIKPTNWHLLQRTPFGTQKIGNHVFYSRSPAVAPEPAVMSAYIKNLRENPALAAIEAQAMMKIPRVSAGGSGLLQMQGSLPNVVRTLPIEPKLATLLDAVATEVGVYLEVYSGGQDETTGYPEGASTRHDHGGAADIKAFTVDANGQKQYITFDNPAGEATWARIVQLSVAGGATGVGAGQGYMGVGSVHIGYDGKDRIVDGKVVMAGGRGRMWGAGKGYGMAAFLAPAYELGTKTPPLPLLDEGAAPIPLKVPSYLAAERGPLRIAPAFEWPDYISDRPGAPPVPRAGLSTPPATAPDYQPVAPVDDAVPLPRPRPDSAPEAPPQKPMVKGPGGKMYEIGSRYTGTDGYVYEIGTDAAGNFKVQRGPRDGFLGGMGPGTMANDIIMGVAAPMLEQAANDAVPIVAAAGEKVAEISGQIGSTVGDFFGGLFKAKPETAASPTDRIDRIIASPGQRTPYYTPPSPAPVPSDPYYKPPSAAPLPRPYYTPPSLAPVPAYFEPDPNLPRQKPAASSSSSSSSSSAATRPVGLSTPPAVAPAPPPPRPPAQPAPTTRPAGLSTPPATATRPVGLSTPPAVVPLPMPKVDVVLPTNGPVTGLSLPALAGPPALAPVAGLRLPTAPPPSTPLLPPETAPVAPIAPAAAPPSAPTRTASAAPQPRRAAIVVPMPAMRRARVFDQNTGRFVDKAVRIDDRVTANGDVYSREGNSWVNKETGVKHTSKPVYGSNGGNYGSAPGQSTAGLKPGDRVYNPDSGSWGLKT